MKVLCAITALLVVQQATGMQDAIPQVDPIPVDLRVSGGLNVGDFSVSTYNRISNTVSKSPLFQTAFGAFTAGYGAHLIASSGNCRKRKNTQPQLSRAALTQPQLSRTALINNHADDDAEMKLEAMERGIRQAEEGEKGCLSRVCPNINWQRAGLGLFYICGGYLIVAINQLPFIAN